MSDNIVEEIQRIRRAARTNGGLIEHNYDLAGSGLASQIDALWNALEVIARHVREQDKS